MPIVTQDIATGTPQKPITQQLQVHSVNRQPKDVAYLQSAIIAADSVYYPDQCRLFDMYSDVLIKDGLLRGIIGKRISQVVNKRLLFMHNEQEVPEMAKVIRSKAFKKIMRQIIWAKMWGLNGLEFLPGKSLAFNLIPKKHIKLKTQHITYEETGVDSGIPYAAMPNIWIMGEIVDEAGNGTTQDYGLLVVCCFLSLLKKGAISDWAQFIEIFGSPAMVLSYKGYDKQAKLAAENIINTVGNSMRITIPEEMSMKFLEGQGASGDGKLQNAFRQACNEELSILILGNTETSGHSGTGTGAKSETHASQQLEIIKDDMDDICDALNSDQFRAILQSYGLPVEGEFQFDREVDIEYLEKKLLVDMPLIQAGAKVSKKYIHDNYALPEPEDEEDTFIYTPAAQPQPAAPGQPGKKVIPPGKPAGDLESRIAAIIDQKFTAFFG